MCCDFAQGSGVGVSYVAPCTDTHQFFTLGTGIDMCIMTKFGLGYHIDTLTPDQLTSYFIVSGGGERARRLPLSKANNRHQAFYLSIVMYNVGLGAIKISILLQYYRIFASRMRRVTVAAMAVVGAWSVALVLISIFTCHPIAAFWDKTIAGGTCIPSLPQWYINAAGNIATDLFIFALPIPVLWRLQLPRSQRPVAHCHLLSGLLVGFSPLPPPPCLAILAAALVW